jgi:peptide chain release factor
VSETWLQISAGQGPAECALAVMRVAERVRVEAAELGLDARVVEAREGPAPGTAESVLIAIGGEAAAAFVASWVGTVQWVGRSPYRPAHKRKNWFVGVEALAPVAELQFAAGALRWETMRASGAGGQHVNRTESAVRVTHVPSGLQATASEERSQHRNRALALARLGKKFAEAEARHQAAAREARWRAHGRLERGNPVRTLRE